MDEERDRVENDDPDRELTRRDFVAMSLAAGLAAAAGRRRPRELPVVETNVDDQDARRHVRRRLHPSRHRRRTRP